MASIKKSLLSVHWQPTLQFVRFRKVNIQKPFPPHFERAKVEELCKPYFQKSKFKDPNTPLKDICKVGTKYFQKEKVDNPYVTLLAKDMRNWFDHSQIIAFFHKCPMDSDELFQARILLKKLDMRLKVHGVEVMTAAVKGTKYEPVLSLYQSHTVVAFGPTADVKALLKSTKKMPKLILLSAVVDDRLMSRAELEFYGSLPDLQTARASLVSVLNSAAQSVVTSLNYHQSQLVRHLQSHVEIQSKKEET